MLEIIEKIQKVIDYANRLEEFRKNPEKFLETIEKLPREYLEKIRGWWKNLKLTKTGGNSVNTVRFIILDRILKGDPVSIEIIEEIKYNIRFKNDEYFSEYPDIQMAVQNLERKGKNYFRSWKPFSILMRIYYHKDRKMINEILDKIAKKIQKDNLPEDLNIYISDFLGNNNFGRSHCWFTYYPPSFGDFKDAYQIILVFNPGEISYGINTGWHVKINRVKKYTKVLLDELDEFNYDKFTKKLRSEIFNEFNELNNKLLGFTEDQEEPTQSLEIYANTDINLESIIEALKFSYQIILMGPPGTSKSYLAKQIAEEITNNEDNITLIQFHPGYSYEDFIEAKEPKGGKDLSLEFIPVKKKFALLCKKALNKKEENFVVILDEINRGNVEKIFGELIWAMENRNQSINLLYSNDPLIIPDNLYIIGTMNTVDLSIANIDAALRRRFSIIEIMPDIKFLRKWLNSKFEGNYDEIINRIVKLMHDINLKIKNSERMNEFQSIGHTYFMVNKGKSLIETIEFLKLKWEYSIKPLLLEYHQFNREELREFNQIWDDFEDEIEMILEKYRENGILNDSG